MVTAERPIYPNESRNFHFIEARSGALLWLHSHYSLQEQSGLIAPIVLQHNRRQLAKLGSPLDIFMMVSDRFRFPQCAYSPFLFPENCAQVPVSRHREYSYYLNGKEAPTEVPVQAGQLVRLRVLSVGSEAPWLINMSAVGGGEIVAMDGLDVQRASGDRKVAVAVKWIATAQRVDLLVRVPRDRAACYPIIALGGSQRETVRLPQQRALLLNAGAPCTPIPQHADKPLPPFTHKLGNPNDPLAKLHAKHPLKPRPPDVTFSFGVNGDQYGGFPFFPQSVAGGDCGTPGAAACSPHKWGLPPFRVFRHNVSGREVYTRRPCAGCEHLPHFNDSGLVHVGGGGGPLRCWEWSTTDPAECEHFRPHTVRSQEVAVPGSTTHPPLALCRGQRVQIMLTNANSLEANEGHPFHLHGHTFALRRVERLVNGSWQVDVALGDGGPLFDTVWVPWQQRALIEFDANNPGLWLFHCHNAMHLENGMAWMFVYRPDWHPDCAADDMVWKGNTAWGFEESDTETENT